MPDPAQPSSPVRRTAAWPVRIAGRTIGLVRLGLDWIGGHELSVLLALLITMLSIWGFVAIADQVSDGDTLRFDEWAVRSLRQVQNPAKPIGPDWLAEVGRDLTALGGVAVMAMLTAAVAGFLWLRRAYGAMWLVLVATFGGLITSTILKNLFDRPRPAVVPHLSLVYTSSFPSGHAMLSATVYLTLGALLGRVVIQRRLKAYFLVIALGLTFLVGVSRVYMGVHYPSDVLAGWAAGLAWATLCWLVARYLQQRGSVEKNVAEVPLELNAEASPIPIQPNATLDKRDQ